MKNKGVLYLTAAILLFATTDIAIKSAGQVFHPLQMNAIRFLIGGLMLMPLARRTRRQQPQRLTGGDWLCIGGLGILCVVCAMTLYTVSVQYIPAGLAAILFAANTFAAIGLAAVVLRERISRPIRLALLLCLMGLSLILSAHLPGGRLMGMLLNLGSAVLFALYAVWGRKLTRDRDISSAVLTSYGFLIGSGVLLLLIGFSHLPAVSGWLIASGRDALASIPLFSGITAASLPGLLYVAFFVTGAGYLNYFLSMETGSIVFASLAFFLKPVLSPILAFWILGETIGLTQFAGILLITAGSAIIFIQNLKQLPATASKNAGGPAAPKG